MSCMSEKTDGNDKEKIAGGNRLTASFYGKEFRIHFAKDILRVLGKPHYICIKVNKDLSSFIITPCEGKMNMSFHVPESLFSENGVKMRIGSQGFVLDLYLKNGMIAEHGTHEELMEKGGDYCRMFTTQRRQYFAQEGENDAV